MNAFFCFIFTTAVLFDSQINNSFVHLQIIPEIMYRMVSLPRNKPSSSRIFATPPILPYQRWWWTGEQCLLFSTLPPYLLGVFFFCNNSSLLYVIRGPHLHYVAKKKTNPMCGQCTQVNSIRMIYSSSSR